MVRVGDLGGEQLGRRAAIVEHAVRIERLDRSRITRFLEFADRCTLGSLASVREARRVADGQMFLCAVYLDQVIGCTSWYAWYRRSYIDLGGRTAQSTCVYLCSSEVLPEFRGLGVGGKLYSRRLAECRRLAPIVMVEILGRGTPFSVDDRARPGLGWHLARGFHIIGHSREDDAGPVLTWAEPTTSRLGGRGASRPDH